jgi:predicted enzyme related to lactoylglutathione lyase
VNIHLPRIIHFEIPAANPERAAEFYRKALNWKIEKYIGGFDYWLITTGEDKEPGINGAIIWNKTFKTIVNSVGVPSIDEALQKIVDAGGKVVMPKGAVPGMGYVAYASDTEGNVFGLFQNDPNAK